MIHVDKNQHIGIYLYLQTYVEQSMYRVKEICKILSSVLESLSNESILEILDSSTSSPLNMVRQLYEHMHIVSSSLTSLSNSLQRLLKKPGYLLPLCQMLHHLSRISVLTSRFAATLEELQIMCPSIVVNLQHLKIRMSSLASLLNVLGLSVRVLDSDMLLIYQNVLELYIQSMDSLLMSNFPNLERHITQILHSLYPSLKNHI